MAPEIQIVRISFPLTSKKDEQYVAAIVALWRRYSNKLGELPSEDKILEYISKQKLLGVISPNGQCVAYGMYKENNQLAQIKHICVQKSWRNHGLGKRILEKIIDDASHLHEVKVLCRRDYNLDKLWRSCGFVAIKDRDGRNHKNQPITEWSLQYGRPSLLTLLHETTITTKICTVIDTNIFIDLTEDSLTRNREDSLVLESEWLSKDVEICVTSEIFNDLDRTNDRQVRELRKAKVHQFRVIPDAQEKYSEVKKEIRKYFSTPLTEQDQSDMGHLVRAIAGNAQCFITRDAGLLQLDDPIYQEFGLTIFRPSDFILYIDSLSQEAKYQPRRFSGTAIEAQLVVPGKQKELIETFQNHKSGERKSELTNKIRDLVSKTEQFECHTLRDALNKELICFFAYEKSIQKELRVSFFRVNESIKYSKEIASHLIFKFVRIAIRKNCNAVIVEDLLMPDFIKEALELDGFFSCGQIYTKIVLNKIIKSSEFTNEVKALLKSISEPQQNLLSQIDQSNMSSESFFDKSVVAIDIEKMFYPLKVFDAELPSYIIPIRPEWAEEFVDEELASLLLFGANRDLMMRREMAYYSLSQASEIHLIR
jgi:predicted nucleic acid-binding protein/GNAT superfamily N-acetyltransferase